MGPTKIRSAGIIPIRRHKSAGKSKAQHQRGSRTTPSTWHHEVQETIKAQMSILEARLYVHICLRAKLFIDHFNLQKRYTVYLRANCAVRDDSPQRMGEISPTFGASYLCSHFGGISPQRYLVAFNNLRRPNQATPYQWLSIMGTEEPSISLAKESSAASLYQTTQFALEQ